MNIFYFNGGRSFLPLFMFSDVLLAVLAGNEHWPPAKPLIKSRGSWWVCPLHQAAFPGVCDRMRCSGPKVWLSPVDKTLLSHIVQMNLMLNIIFVPSLFVYRFQHSQTSPLLFYVLFLCCLTIIVIITLGNDSACVCVYTILCSLPS